MQFTFLLIYALAVTTNAIGDAFNDSSRKKLGHLFNSISIAVLLLVPFIDTPTLWMVAVYVLLRMSIFDISYNLARGLKWYYVGKSSWWDDIFRKAPPSMMVLFRAIMLSAAIGICINANAL
mgnify:CR=1 FL=1